MTNSNITAKLENVALLCDSEENPWIAYGDILGDSKGRFVDGTPIRTSKIQRIEDGIIYTRNSIYEIVSYADRSPKFDFYQIKSEEV